MSKRSGTLYRIASAITILLLMLTLFFVYRSGPLRVYKNTHIGDTMSATKERIGQPAATVSVGTCSCLYYPNSNEQVRIDSGITSVESIEKLPWIYGALQLLFDKSGKLVAYDWNGETVSMYTKDGKYDDGKFLEHAARLSEYCD